MPFYLILLTVLGGNSAQKTADYYPKFSVSKNKLFLECNGVPNKENLTKELKKLVELMKNPYGPSFGVSNEDNEDKFGKSWDDAVANLSPEDQFYFKQI